MEIQFTPPTYPRQYKLSHKQKNLQSDLLPTKKYDTSRICYEYSSAKDLAKLAQVSKISCLLAREAAWQYLKSQNISISGYSMKTTPWIELARNVSLALKCSQNALHNKNLTLAQLMKKKKF